MNANNNNSTPRAAVFQTAGAIAVAVGAGTLWLAAAGCSTASEPTPPVAPQTITPLEASDDLVPIAARVRYDATLDSLIFELDVAGTIGGTVPTERGQLNGAPVLGYVFPTTLPSTAVGFGEVDGVVALAITSHPDFDDTPLWDENADADYGNDGVVWHPHWVLLAPDERIDALAVRGISDPATATLPPTNPGMPMYMDSPGFHVILDGSTLRVIVPAPRVRNQITFQYDAVVAYMQVMQHPDYPLLGVYQVYGVLSGDLSLPYEVVQPD